MAVVVDLIDHHEIARVRAGVEMARAVAAVAAVAGARAVGMRAVMIAFFVLASMPAALEGAGQLLVGADRSTGVVAPAAEDDEVRLASLGPLGCCTLTASVAYRHSHWQLGGLG